MSLAGEPLLQVEGLEAGYAGCQALFGLALQVEAGEMVAVVGGRGAGKSTLLEVIMGLVPLSAGAILFAGEDLADIPTHRRVELGISLVPRERRVFPSLSVDENLEVGGRLQRDGSWTKITVYGAFPVLAHLASRPADRLSGGEQQALAIGRALMANPRLLLVDEISLGLAADEAHELYDAIGRVAAAGTAILLAEHDVNQALRAATPVYCLLDGEVSLHADAATVDRELLGTAYFGMGFDGGDDP